jgi:hypothetical protein
MGLTLHYELAAPACPAAKARSLVEALRKHALSLPFESVSEVIELKGEDCRFNPKNRNAPHAWLKVQTMRFVIDAKGNVGTIAAETYPLHTIAFTVDPTEGSENANFGLCKYPKTAGWLWASFCKTQYASNPSTGDVANFLKCHLGLVALLDKAKEMGILGKVHDEGKYFDNRDVAALIKEIGAWNTMIAGFYGGLRDGIEAAGGDPRSLVAEIAKFQNFERLEAEGRKGED